MRLPAGGQRQLQVRGALRAAQRHNQRGELGARADRDALQKLEVIDGVQFLDVIRRRRSMPDDGRIDAGDERLGPGATAQVVGSVVASIRVAGGCAQQQGLGGVDLGRVSMTAPA